jgi:diaminopimelate dehydrogenase
MADERKKFKVAVAGYGNLGRGVIDNIGNFPDLVLGGIFSRRKIDAPVPVFSYEESNNLKGEFDAVIMCGGSAADLPVQSPEMAKYFNIVDSFDTHAKALIHLKNVDSAAKEGGNLAIISAGWDPGLFSLQRLLFASILPAGNGNTFWGKGVSQGHSDAVRRIKGVKAAIQYTVPKDPALFSAKNSPEIELSARDKHLREVFIVAEPDADKPLIESAVKNMPDYFLPYDTEVYFISQEEFDRVHKGLPHGGEVLSGGLTANGHKNILDFSISLGSNPDFTASVLLAYTRAVIRLRQIGRVGALTVFDVPYSYLFIGGGEEIIRRFL